MDQQQANQTNPKAQALAEEALENAMMRVAGVLTEEDINMLEQIDENDPTGEQSKGYLVSKVPNFEAILQEEALKLIKTQNQNK